MHPGTGVRIHWSVHSNLNWLVTLRLSILGPSCSNSRTDAAVRHGSVPQHRAADNRSRSFQGHPRNIPRPCRWSISIVIDFSYTIVSNRYGRIHVTQNMRGNKCLGHYTMHRSPWLNFLVRLYRICLCYLERERIQLFEAFHRTPQSKPWTHDAQIYKIESPLNDCAKSAFPDSCYAEHERNRLLRDGCALHRMSHDSLERTMHRSSFINY